MKTVILCGGKGTRLREMTERIPKPLVEIGGKPILWHIMKLYSHQGFNDFVLATGYKGSMIKEYFADNDEGWSIECVDTGEETNTGGRIKKVESYVDGDKFLVTYGDGLADIDLKQLLQHHKNKGKIATVTVVQPHSQFGIVDIDDRDIVQKFQEKPQLTHWINGGFFVFNKEVFDYIGENDILEKEVFERLAAEKNIAAFKLHGFWDCMDTFKDMQVLNDQWNSGRAEWKVWE